MEEELRDEELCDEEGLRFEDGFCGDKGGYELVDSGGEPRRVLAVII